MLSHAIAQIESGSLWRHQSMQDTGVLHEVRWTHDSILLICRSLNPRPCVWAAVGSALLAAAVSPRGALPLPPLHHPAAAAAAAAAPPPPGHPPAPASPPAALPPPPPPAPAAALTPEELPLLATLSRSATLLRCSTRASAGGHSLRQAKL